MQRLIKKSPQKVWSYFAKMAEIPHGSKNEEAIANFVMEEGKKLGLEVERDEVGNVLIRKPATVGMEKAKGVVLQGHLDMVCEKNSNVQHDFSKDPLKLVVDGDFLKAEGTTLGADNAIAVAMGLAILADNKVKHGPLECLFTVDEEDGMTGALNLREKWLKGKYLLNLDSEEEGEFYIGCAGGLNSTLKTVYREVAPTAGKVPCKLMISGLRGGHSGCNIHEGLGNAIKLLARFLWSYTRAFHLEIAEIVGGNKSNAIAREAYAIVYLDPEHISSLQKVAVDYTKDLINEYGDIEKKVEVTVKETNEAPAMVMAADADWRIIGFLYTAPHGVRAMSPNLPGLVQTSTNLASVVAKNGKVLVMMSHRSSVESSLIAVAKMVSAYAALTQFSCEQSDGYPGWQPNPKSELLAKAQDVYQKMFKKEAAVKAIHAGLECGVIGKKYPKMEMISYGPNIFNPHSPDERLEIETVGRCYKFTIALLEHLAK